MKKPDKSFVDSNPEPNLKRSKSDGDRPPSRFGHLLPERLSDYAVFIASPGDMDAERRELRQFFEVYNASIARNWGVRFSVIDWEGYSSAGVGDPQDLITKQTLERFETSLALVIGLMGQRFGSPTTKCESGTEEECEWALSRNKERGIPELKWFFRKVDHFQSEPDPCQIADALAQWQKVIAFKERLRTRTPPVYWKEFTDIESFRAIALTDLRAWLSSPDRSWFTRPGEEAPIVVAQAPELYQVLCRDVRLYLHSETDSQHDYFDSVIEDLKAALNAEVTQAAATKSHLHLASQAPIQEIQIIQLDEFWTYSPGFVTSQPASLTPLKIPPADKLDWAVVLPREETANADRSIFALPFYLNLGVLVCKDTEHQIKHEWATWTELAETCFEWERAHSAPSEEGSLPVFFDFPKATVSNLNCLFFEILFSLRPPLFASSDSGTVDAKAHLQESEAVDAALIFRGLCRRAHQVEMNRVPMWRPIDHYALAKPQLVEGAVAIQQNAVVARHWYSTAHAMLSALPPEDRRHVKVIPLPGGLSLRGDWFLGIQCSAEQEQIALGIINGLTTRRAEMERLQLGVGLPTRASFYTADAESHDELTPLSSCVSMRFRDLRKTFNSAIPLSRLNGYSQWASALSFCLQRILELDSEKDALKGQVRSVLSHFNRQSSYMEPPTSEHTSVLEEINDSKHPDHLASD